MGRSDERYRQHDGRNGHRPRRPPPWPAGRWSAAPRELERMQPAAVAVILRRHLDEAGDI
ncbi:MAG: hypothetical protein R2755_19970 [Acidimicrobiales bacterium]